METARPSVECWEELVLVAEDSDTILKSSINIMMISDNINIC